MESEGLADPLPQAGRGRQVTTHVRPGRMRSIRLRLLLPIVLAAAGLVALGSVQTSAAVGQVEASDRAEAVASLAIATTQLEDALEVEISEADGVNARGGSGHALLDSVRGQTDLALANFQTVSDKAQRTAPALRDVINATDGQLAGLTQVRRSVVAPAVDSALAGPRYEQIGQSLLELADALPDQIDDPDLAATARAISAITAAAHVGAQQRDLLRGLFQRGAFAPGELVKLAGLVAQQDTRIAEFTRNATRAQQVEYKSRLTGSDVQIAGTIRAAVLAPTPAPEALDADPDGWYIAQSNLLRRMRLVQSDLSYTLQRSATLQRASAANQAVATSLGTAAIILLSFGAALVFATRTSRRLRQLRAVALRVANAELPNAIATLTEALDPVAVRGAMHESVNRAHSLAVSGGDEIGEVGVALSTLHRQALRLAADEALLRLDIGRLIIALSRRGQTLIHRQLRLIDDYERSETDPDALGKLFALDHLAARMRRNEENLLVLAGGEPGRRVTSPVPLVDVIRAAGAEIEDHDRVEPVAVAEVAIAAYVARDVIHLLAELLENATAFSPPRSKVRVSARRTVDSVTVTVFDEGIGISRDQVTQLNERLRHPTVLTSELAGTMGLLVVARLAARHGIGVELRSTANAGTAALVALPISMLAPIPLDPVDIDLGTRLTPRPLAASAAPTPPAAPPSWPIGPPGTPAFAASSTYPVDAVRYPADPVSYPADPVGYPADPVGPVPAYLGLPGIPEYVPKSGVPPEVPVSRPMPAGPVRPAPAPTPALSTPMPVPTMATSSTLPASAPGGLPRRMPSSRPANGTSSFPPVPLAPSDTVRPPDPDTVRARLSGLASGLAAAAKEAPPRSKS